MNHERKTLRTPHRPPPLVLPCPRATVRHALPNLVEGKVIPLVLFVGLLQLAGTAAALIGALGFSLAALARRVARQRQVSGILVLTTIGLVARTAAALATGSLVIYFLQPTVATALVALAFVGSVALGRPLAERLLLDVCPIDDEHRANPHLRRFLGHLSLWWGFTSAVNFGVTLWLLLTASPTTFVLAKSLLGPVSTTMTLGVGLVWFRMLMARSGTQVVFASTR